ncbi:flagellar basal body P-ring formation chaperone FlgA [Hydrogenophaga sp. PBL-H3]|uniref:flagellar basal body P-ring formation chaperone FlgA n=1 Tax=Hydrogenophaga sp. PBL-H3 TaxID=434010 RepID=UPI0013202255|nr:flagellar basal body P-ring formation chaperone FlgA [Hydrogenophaga sp. PBL-H3]QHE77635.1 flagellar basal body P-ring formation protein FlgA [Hydrogenophaga sp. PBL-H3]QHE82059.1 flagellar basal body P-ring formation protein FlgA [Hydrogenophaga sp. PBL-H3]
MPTLLPSLLSPLTARLIALVALLLCGWSARANEPAALEKMAHDFLTPALAAALPKDADSPLRAEVVMGSLDARLKLAPCNQVEPYLPPGTRLWGRSRIGLRCVDGPTRWNVFVPVTVKAWGPAWVLKRAVAAGDALTQEDAEIAEIDWAEQRSSVLALPERWVGQLAAFPLTAGMALRENMVRVPQAFAAGAQVRVSGQGGGFSISATGQALTAGMVGEPARVKLPGGRVVTGVVRDAQTVELAL